MVVGRGSGAAAPRDAGRRPPCRHSHKPWSGAELDHESDEKPDRERNQERLSAATRCRRQRRGAQDRYIVTVHMHGHAQMHIHASGGVSTTAAYIATDSQDVVAAFGDRFGLCYRLP